ncbi:PhnD/SsuA/transferrin family substrate-binding protein, partial [bacterium]|nr:PhnD/SsuA/transferrin family substrate-binding protein [bacterium]
MNLIRSALLTCIILFITPLAAAFAAPEKILTLGILALRPKSQMAVAWQPLADQLTEKLPGYRVQLLLLDHKEMLAELQQQRLDFVLTNPSHYILLRQKTGLSGSLATMIPREGPLALTSFGGVIFTRSNRIQAVIEGKADAGFVRTGLIEQLSRQGKIPSDSFKIINRQELPSFPYASSTRLYPEWPFVALPHVETRLAAKVAATLLGIDPDTPSLRAAGIHSFAIPADYQPVEQLLRELRLPPFDQSPPFTLR